jgi:hypothetical protein
LWFSFVFFFAYGEARNQKIRQAQQRKCEIKKNKKRNQKGKTSPKKLYFFVFCETAKITGKR